MTTVRDISKYFEEKIPSEMKMDFDNVGLLVGIGETPVSRALFSLDITDEVIEEAIGLDAQIIISHHPMFFDLKRVSDSDANGGRVVRLLRSGISALCLHTNFDSVDGGVNDALARAIGVKCEGRLDDLVTSSGAEYGIGRFGRLRAPMTLPEYLAFVKTALGTGGIRYPMRAAPSIRSPSAAAAAGSISRAQPLWAATPLLPPILSITSC